MSSRHLRCNLPLFTFSGVPKLILLNLALHIHVHKCQIDLLVEPWWLILFTLNNPRFLDLQVLNLKHANPMVSCLGYLDWILFQMGEFLGPWFGMHGLVYGSTRTLWRRKTRW